MAHPRQQAMFFLLGAVLVGGVLGFSADRVMHRPPHTWAERTTMYDDLGLNATQRARSDSIWDATDCAMSRVSAPVYPVLDSIRLDGRRRFRDVLTAPQRDILEARIQADSVRRARADSVRRAHGDTTRHRPSNLRQDTCKQ